MVNTYWATSETGAGTQVWLVRRHGMQMLHKETMSH